MNKKGLGDIVEIMTKYTGIKWLVKKVVGEDCGCDERKEFLNKITPKIKLPKVNIPKISFKKKPNIGEPEKLIESGKLKGKSFNQYQASIFVQIASYRDPELNKTLVDLLDKAANPERLHICVAHQFSDDDDFNLTDKYRKDKRFTIVDVPYEDSQGVCWARNLVQQNYRGEMYTLQLDSHHRFVKDWDVECIKMMEQLQAKGYKKPLLTSYIPSFNPENDPEDRVQVPWKMNFDRFTPEGVVFFLPASIDNFEELDEPVPSRFYSAHFAFTLGIFTQEVQHDPSFYFHGEEITIAVRAWTHGYDLFHPHKVIAWHEYTRKGRTKHWDDDPKWVERNKNTHAKVRKLLGIDGEICTPCNVRAFGKYYLGKERTLQEYEIFAGIRFKDRGIQQWTLDNKYPPNPMVDDFENSFFQKFRHCIDLHKNNVTETDYEFWAVAFHHKDGTELFRKDASAGEVRGYLNGESEWINIWREYNGPVPDSWSVWPYSKSKGWCQRLTGKLKS